MQEGHVIQTENTYFLLFLLRNCPLRAWHRYDRKLGKTVLFINVREDQVDRFLSKVIKGSAGFNDVSEKGMIFRSLPLLFLRYTLGVCKGNCCGSSSRNRYTQTEPSRLGHISSVRTNELVYDPIWIFTSPEIVV